MTFKQALKYMPKFLIGGFDPLYHKTVNDLLFLARLEKDLYVDGEIELTKKQVSSLCRYIVRLENKEGQ